MYHQLVQGSLLNFDVPVILQIITYVVLTKDGGM